MDDSGFRKDDEYYLAYQSIHAFHRKYAENDTVILAGYIRAVEALTQSFDSYSPKCHEFACEFLSCVTSDICKRKGW